jgi:hypothetical protein
MHRLLEIIILILPLMFLSTTSEASIVGTSKIERAGNTGVSLAQAKKLKKKSKKKSRKKKIKARKKKKYAKKKVLRKKIKRSFMARKWPYFAAVSAIFIGIGLFLGLQKNQRDNMRFNFVESDINRSPHSRQHAALKSQPVTNIHKEKVSRSSSISGRSYHGKQSYSPQPSSPLANISCELNFNNPAEDHGCPRDNWHKTSA